LRLGRGFGCFLRAPDDGSCPLVCQAGPSDLFPPPPRRMCRVGPIPQDEGAVAQSVRAAVAVRGCPSVAPLPAPSMGTEHNGTERLPPSCDGTVLRLAVGLNKRKREKKNHITTK